MPSKQYFAVRDAFVSKFVSEHSHESEAVAYSVKGFQDLWSKVKQFGEDPDDVMAEFAYLVDSKLPSSNVRERMESAIVCCSPNYPGAVKKPLHGK